MRNKQLWSNSPSSPKYFCALPHLGSKQPQLLSFTSPFSSVNKNLIAPLKKAVSSGGTVTVNFKGEDGKVRATQLDVTKEDQAYINEFSRLYTKNKLVDKELKELKVKNIFFKLISFIIGKIGKFRRCRSSNWRKLWKHY